MRKTIIAIISALSFIAVEPIVTYAAPAQTPQAAGKQKTTKKSVAAKSTAGKPANAKPKNVWVDEVQEITLDSITFRMIPVKGGSFYRGKENDKFFNPYHKVTLSDYYIGETEVTQDLWEKVMGYNLSKYKGDKLPAQDMSWYDCQTFIKRLNDLTGYTFCLPSEAEWEFAARGGNLTHDYKYSGSDNAKEVGWTLDNHASRPMEVAKKLPNELGIYDMTGNVTEWCNDFFAGYPNKDVIDPKGPSQPSTSGHVTRRGGSWYEPAAEVKERGSGVPDVAGDRGFVGFRLGLRSIERKPVAAKPVGSKAGVDPSVKRDTIEVNGVKFNMIFVEGGTFKMGKPKGNYNNSTVHPVTLSDYYIGETEVTQDLWEAVMGYNRSQARAPKRPVENVSWEDCQDFINKLNELTGKKFCLPSEAEWEYAARGGNKSKGFTYSGSNDISKVGWNANNAKTTSEVAQLAPNELGIYDMTGNVYEWCQDIKYYYESDSQTNPLFVPTNEYREHYITRGGCVFAYPERCTVTIRNDERAREFTRGIGFRLCMHDSEPAYTIIKVDN